VRIFSVATVLATGALASLAVGCSGSNEATTSSATTTTENAGAAVTQTSETPTATIDLRAFMPAADAIGSGAKLMDEGGGTAHALHGILGREGKSYDFQVRTFDVREVAFHESPDAGAAITEVERWANEDDSSRRLFDWLIEPSGSEAELIAKDQRRGFLARLLAFGLRAKHIEVRRAILPPGLGESSVGGTIDFEAAGHALDDAVVLFRCGPLVGSVDLIGPSGDVAIRDSMEIASTMARKMGETCA
jgi:hypothetical protein